MDGKRATEKVRRGKRGDAGTESGYKIKPGAGTCDSPLLICMPSRERDAIEYLRRPKRESTLAALQQQ